MMSDNDNSNNSGDDELKGQHEPPQLFQLECRPQSIRVAYSKCQFRIRSSSIPKKGPNSLEERQLEALWTSGLIDDQISWHMEARSQHTLTHFYARSWTQLSALARPKRLGSALGERYPAMSRGVTG